MSTPMRSRAAGVPRGAHTVATMRTRSLSRPRRRASVRGGVILEMTLLMPFFIALLFLVWDVGTLLLYRSQVINVAYATARQAAQYGEYDQFRANGTARQNLLAPTGPLPNRALTVTGRVVGGPLGGGTRCATTNADVRVTITYDYQVPFDFFGLIGGSPQGGMTLSGTGVARCEVVR